MIAATLCVVVLFGSGLLAHADDADLQARIEKMEQVHAENADLQARMERMEDYMEKIEEYSKKLEALSAGELIYSTG